MRIGARRVVLGSVAQIQLGKMLSPKSKTGKSAFPYLRNQNVQWDRIELADLAEMDFSPEERIKFSLIAGDLLVCEGGEPGRAAIWRGDLVDCYFQKAIHRIRPHDGVEPEYLLFMFWHFSNSRVFSDANSQTTIAHLPLGRLKALPISLPAHPQQLAVARALRDQLGAANEAAAAVCAQLAMTDEALKRSVLTAFFGGQAPIRMLHSGESPPGWSIFALGLSARIESGHTPSRRRPEWWGGDVPWLALPDIRKLHGKFAYETTENTNDAGLKNSSARLLPVGTVCLCRDASIGFVTMLGRPMATSQHFCNWVCDPERLDAEFLMYAFMASFDALRELGSGSVLKTIYMPTVQSFHVCAPALDEQRRIARSLRDKLAAAEALSTHLRERQAEIAQLPRRLLAAAFEPVA